MTSDDFIAKYPEFRTSGALVSTALEYAELHASADVFGARTDEAVGLYAAHWLAIHPYGRSQRGDDDTKSDQETRYLLEFKRLMRVVGCHVPMVI